MTVSQLIRKLKKLPPNALVGVAHGDNSEHEVAGWVSYAGLHEKSDFDADRLSREDRECFDGHPERWVTLHC